MSKRINVNVGFHEIQNGQQASIWSCPVSLGMQNAGLSQPLAGINRLSWNDHNTKKRVVIASPPEVTKFIIDFDARKNVEPLSFQIEIP